MNLLAVYGEDYPWDVRVEKLLRGFQSAGHATLLVCRNLKRRPIMESASGLSCLRVLGPRLPSLVHRVATLPAPGNPVWTRAIRRALRGFSPDLLLVRDLPLATLVIREARRLRIPAVVDMAENYPAMWQNVCDSDPFPLRSRLLKNPAVARRLEHRVLRSASAIFVVVQEMRDRLVGLGADPARIHLVSNTPPLAILRHSFGSAPRPHDGLDLVYAGFVTRTRGLQHVLRGMAGEGVSAAVRLQIAGSGPYLADLRRLAEDLHVSDRVTFHGWVDPLELPARIATCDIGVIPHLRTEHTNTTAPNKLFDYMALGLPVIASDAVPLRRIVTEEACGVLFSEEDPGSFRRCLQTLSRSEVRAAMGSRGREAVRRKYHWENDLQTALRAIESCAAPADAAGRPAEGRS